MTDSLKQQKLHVVILECSYIAYSMEHAIAWRYSDCTVGLFITSTEHSFDLCYLHHVALARLGEQAGRDRELEFACAAAMNRYSDIV